MQGGRQLDGRRDPGRKFEARWILGKRCDTLENGSKGAAETVTELQCDVMLLLIPYGHAL